MSVSNFSWCLRNNDLDSRSYAKVARLAEELGYYGVFSVEGTLRSALPNLVTGKIRSAFVNNAVAAVSTEKIKLGTSIVSIYSRTPLAVAMEAMTLNELSGGRFILGVGVGGPWLVQKGYGYPLDKPAVRMREFLTIVKSAMSGETVNFTGSFYNVRDVKMERLTEFRPLLYMAGLNPYSLRAGGALADGVILNMFPIKALSYAKEKIAEGARKAGRDPKEVKLAVLTPCAASDDPAIEKELKTGVAFYCNVETHHDFLSYAGLGQEARRLNEIWSREGPDAAVSHVPEELLEVLTLGDDPRTIKRSAQEYVHAGAHPLIYPHYVKSGGVEPVLELIKDVARA